MIPDAEFTRIRDRLLHNSVQEEEGGCRSWLGKAHQGQYGKTHIRIRDDNGLLVINTTITCHRAIFMATNKVLLDNSDNDVSHLCHNARCININHLFLEHHTINMSRIQCKNDGECHGHPAPSPNCML